MLPVLRRVVDAGITVVGDGGAGEVEGAAVDGGDNFDCVGVGYVLRSAEDFERGGGRVKGRRRAVRCSGLRRGSSPWILT